MKPTKAERQERLLELIATQPVATQADLVAQLQADGLEITQATISRDIKELNIIKVTGADGKQRYVCMSKDMDQPGGRLMKVFAEAVISVHCAQNLLILHTLPGMAGAGASAIDSMELPEVLGSIAGDDTVFVATKDVASAESLRKRLKQFV